MQPRVWPRRLLRGGGEQRGPRHTFLNPSGALTGADGLPGAGHLLVPRGKRPETWSRSEPFEARPPRPPASRSGERASVRRLPVGPSRALWPGQVAGPWVSGRGSGRLTPGEPAGAGPEGAGDQPVRGPHRQLHTCPPQRADLTAVIFLGGRQTRDRTTGSERSLGGISGGTGSREVLQLPGGLSTAVGYLLSFFSIDSTVDLRGFSCSSKVEGISFTS